jgi:hypothetical protein
VRTALSAILLVATTVAAQADPSQYLCVAEQSAGFHYDRQTKAWHRSLLHIKNIFFVD